MTNTTAEIEFSESVSDALDAVKKAIRVRWEYYTHSRPTLDEFTAAVGRALVTHPQNQHLAQSRWTPPEWHQPGVPSDQ